MMSELKPMSVQKRAEMALDVYNHINALLDDHDTIKNRIAYQIANGRNKYILYDENYRKKVNYYDIVYKMVIYPRTDTIKSRIKQIFPECKVVTRYAEYRNIPDQYELLITWRTGGCFG